MSQEVLQDRIISMSSSNVWDEAVLQWRLIDIEMSDDHHTCLCGHHPIRELCTIGNSSTNETAVVSGGR